MTQIDDYTKGPPYLIHCLQQFGQPTLVTVLSHILVGQATCIGYIVTVLCNHLEC
jgi:hypothetical protein